MAIRTSFSTDAVASQLRFLQAFVLFTCMGVVVLAVPIAGLIARHITVPIQQLAFCARTGGRRPVAPGGHRPA